MVAKYPNCIETEHYFGIVLISSLEPQNMRHYDYGMRAVFAVLVQAGRPESPVQWVGNSNDAYVVSPAFRP